VTKKVGLLLFGVVSLEEGNASDDTVTVFLTDKTLPIKTQIN
jgi:hypothetical protein